MLTLWCKGQWPANATHSKPPCVLKSSQDGLRSQRSTQMLSPSPPAVPRVPQVAAALSVLAKRPAGPSSCRHCRRPRLAERSGCPRRTRPRWFPAFCVVSVADGARGACRMDPKQHDTIYGTLKYIYPVLVRCGYTCILFMNIVGVRGEDGITPEMLKCIVLPLNHAAQHRWGQGGQQLRQQQR